jgi:hypothetical protein
MGRIPAEVSPRWLRVLGALVVAVVVGLGIRSLLLPAQSACVFLEYAESAAWERAPDSPLFRGGELSFAGREPIQLGGEDLGAWDEVAIVDFGNTDDYEAFRERLAAEERLARYHLMEVTPGPPEFLYFLNLRLRSDRGDESIDPGPAARIEDAVGEPRYLARWRDLFEGSYRGPIVMLNLLTNRADPQDPVGAPESDATTEELHDRYQQKALRVLGKMGAQIAAIGTVDRVAVGPPVRHYDDYGFALYPSVNAFETVFTAQERLDARVHRDAALNADRSAGYWVKPYEEFAPTAK